MAYELREDDIIRLEQELETTDDEKRKEEIQRSLETGVINDYPKEVRDYERKLYRRARLKEKAKEGVKYFFVYTVLIYLLACALQACLISRYQLISLADEPEVIETLKGFLWEWNIFRGILIK